MDPPAPPPAVDALIENLAWMRALARRMVSDPHRADDALQEAWLAASKAGALPRRPGRRWLARVLRNRARSEQRSRDARDRREQLAAPIEVPIDDPSELAAEAEVGQRLGRAVLELDEPYRSTVLLRYWRGLGPEEIARLENVPASTVRTRLKRALDKLRARAAQEFEQETGGWIGALSPLAGFTPPAMLGGIVLMNKTTFVAAAALAVVLAALGARELAASARARAIAGRDGESELARLETPSASRELGTPAETTARAAAEPSARDVDRIHGRLSSVGGGAVADARVLLHVSNEERPELARSGEDGRFDLELPLAADARLAVCARDYLELRLEPGELPREAGASFEVVMHPLGVLDVSVVDESGVPIEDAVLSVSSHFEAAPWTRDVRRTGRTATDGRCSVDGLPCGVAVSVAVVGVVGSAIAKIDPVERFARIEIRRPAAGIVTGSVLDEAGAPAPGVRVKLDDSAGSWSQRTLTDAEGRFHYTGIAPGDVAVRVPRLGADPAAGALEPGGILELEPIRLSGLVPFAGRVVSALEYDTREFGVELFRDGVRIAEDVLWLDDDGRFSTRIPPGPVVVRVSQHSTFMNVTSRGVAGRSSLRELGEVARELSAAPEPSIEISIDQGVGAISGELALASYEGRAALHFYAGDATTEELLADPRAFLWQQSGLDIVEGRFCSRAIRAGTYHVAIEVHGKGTAWLSRVRVGPGWNDVGTVVLDEPTGSIRGRVVDANDQPVRAALVSMHLPWNGNVGGNLVTDDEGRFHERGLSSGVWRLHAEREGLGVSPLLAVSVAGDETEVELRIELPGRVRVQLLRDGAPVAGHELSLGRARGTAIELETFGVTDAAGEGLFNAVAPGHVVVFAGRGGGRSIEATSGAETFVRLELGGHENEVVLEWRGAPLEGISMCTLLDVDSTSSTHGAVRYPALLPDGRIRLRPFEGESLLAVRTDVFDPPAHLVVLVDGARLPERIAFSEQALALDTGTTESHLAAPQLTVAGLVRHTGPFCWPAPIVLPLERGRDPRVSR